MQRWRIRRGGRCLQRLQQGLCWPSASSTSPPNHLRLIHGSMILDHIWTWFLGAGRGDLYAERLICEYIWYMIHSILWLFSVDAAAVSRWHWTVASVVQRECEQFGRRCSGPKHGPWPQHGGHGRPRTGEDVWSYRRQTRFVPRLNNLFRVSPSRFLGRFVKTLKNKAIWYHKLDVRWIFSGYF